MTPRPACDGGENDVLALVREALAARDDVVGFEVHEATAASAVVEIETEESGEATRRTLYRVTHEPSVEGGDADDHLHWTYLGPVGTGN